MGLLAKKCMNCREKIEKGQEHFREVKVPGYIGTFKRAFCSGEHADNYEEEIDNRPKQKGGGGCCG